MASAPPWAEKSDTTQGPRAARPPAAHRPRPRAARHRARTRPVRPRGRCAGGRARRGARRRRRCPGGRRRRRTAAAAADAVRADPDRRQADLGEQRGAWVVDPQVGEEDTVDPAVGGEPPVARQLALAVRHDLQQQGLADRGQRRLDAGDEPGEERVRAEGLRRAGDDQADRERPGRRQGPGPVARRPAQLVRGGEDPVPGLGGHPGRPLSAKDTAPFDTPALRATSEMVGRREVIRV